MTLDQFNRRKQLSGQTLIIALIVLGILLVLGFVFVGLINRNIIQSARAQQRSVVNDLAEAGIRYAHSQMLYSASGADWRPALTPIIDDVTRVGIEDPDYDFLKLGAATAQFPAGDPNTGGPDGLGVYSRVNFGQGRALIRVRYAPSDANLFSTQARGPLRNPGKARPLTMIEAVGRYGSINPKDPTTFYLEDRRESRKLIAFASIGILDQALFITNKDRVSRAAELGMPDPFGTIYADIPGSPSVVLRPTLQIGSSIPMYDFAANPNTIGATPVPFGGGIYSNAPLKFHGDTIANLNASLGDGIYVAGTTEGVDSAANLFINRSAWNTVGNNWQTTTTTLNNLGVTSLDSNNINFTTVNGVFRDSSENTDVTGYWRDIGYKAPPSILTNDPDTGQNRYLVLTQNSGNLGPAGNDGRFGHGRNIYVNNTADRQVATDETGREIQGSDKSLIEEWFNPPTATSGSLTPSWVGPYYIPVGAQVELLPDGFRITRGLNGPVNQRTWRRPDGSDSGQSSIRYRIGQVNGKPYIVNTLTPGVNINDPVPNFSLGREFNGVLYFEGNVRIRGVIPTDIQLTVVSGATMYIEGSITKGVIGNNYTANYPLVADQVPAGTRLSRLSKSMIMLMAKDNVAVNTTMFFGPSTSQNMDPGRDLVRVNTGAGSVTLSSEMLLDPNGSGTNPADPSTWIPYVWGAGPNQGYREFVAAATNTGNRLSSQLLISHTMEDGPATYTMMSMDVNFGIGTAPIAAPWSYLFSIAPLSVSNSVSGLAGYNPGYVFAPDYTVANFAPIYGLGGETWQRFAKFETIGFPIVPDVNTLVLSGDTINSNFGNPLLSLPNNQGEGRYTLKIDGKNDFTLRHNSVAFGSTNNYLLTRSAIVPHDVRIEAGIFAEEGSFVIIPGNWFNMNTNDSREAFNASVATYQAAPHNLPLDQAIQAAQQDRRSNFGSFPEAPFYGEPIDVKINVIGAVSQNMPLAMSYQGEWLRKWGWIPRQLGASYRFGGGTPEPVLIPWGHVPNGFDITTAGADRFVPNLVISYDPAIATASWAGFDNSVPGRYLRYDDSGRPLPPMPRLPVGPTLSYFGEVLR